MNWKVVFAVTMEKKMNIASNTIMPYMPCLYNVYNYIFIFIYCQVLANVNRCKSIACHIQVFMIYIYYNICQAHSQNFPNSKIQGVVPCYPGDW